MTWEPTITRASAPVGYNGSPPWTGREGCSGTFLPGTRKLGEHLRQLFPVIQTVGGYSCRQNTADEDQTSIHGVGRALDLMIDRVDGEADRRGDEVARWLIEHAREVGVQLIIWDGTIWSTLFDPRGAVRAYTGPIRHTDHLHVELNEDGANERLPWFRDRSKDVGLGTSIVLTVAVGSALLLGYRWFKRA